jgi:Tol biopolymer transport system component
LIGKTLAHYEITAEIGKGGMGEVYRARDAKLGREVALKFLPSDFAQDPERLQRFEREARLLASLSHPNIATIHGFERDGEHRFLVLELVEGENLAERIARGRVPTREALSIACRIAEGMEAAHERGVIHRDLKPANIKLTGDGGVKILDFGLARASEPDASHAEIEDSPTVTDFTRDNTVLGTAPYVSPEQLKGGSVDARTDIWAFGCVFYEMLTGASPFWADSTPEIMARILEHEPDWTALPGDLLPSTARLIRRCLAKDPRQRLHAAADIRIVLEEAVEAGPEAATLEVRPRKLWTLRMVIAVVGAFVLGGIAAGLWMKEPQSSSGGDNGAIRLMIPVRDDASVVPIPEASSVAISPDGRFVVYAASNMIGGTRTRLVSEFSNTQLYRRPIGGFEAVPIEGTIGGTCPFFSPDGRWIGFFDFYDGTLKKVARAGGAPLKICYVDKLTFRGAYWTEDGDIYYADSFGLFVVDGNGGEPRSVAAPDQQAGEKTYRFPQLLPGTRTLLFSRGSSEILTYDDADIALLDLESGEVRLLAQKGLDPRYLPTGHILFGRGGKAFALPFDVDRLVTTGPPVKVLDGVVTSDGYGSMQLSCSDEGTLVYVAGGPEQFSRELMVLHRDGRVEEISQPPRSFGSVRLSPEAGRILVSVLGANASVWIYDLERGTMTKLVSGWDNFSPIWNDSGDEIAFASNRGGKNGVWITSSDGTGSPKLLLDRWSNLFPGSWSPKGDWLTFAALSPSTGLDIWVADSTGTATPAIQTSAREHRSKFSPDGRYLAYTSDESGRLEIYVQTFPITGRKWKLSEDGGELPLWSREGDEIFYWNEQRLMAVSVDLEPEFRPSRARPVLETDIEVHDYDVFPGADRFIVLGRSATRLRAGASIARQGAEGRIFPAQSPDIHVVLNWFEELSRLAPPR